MYTEFHLRVKSVNNRIRKTNSKSQRYREKKGNGRGVLSADFFFFPIRHGETYYKMWGPRQSTPWPETLVEEKGRRRPADCLFSVVTCPVCKAENAPATSVDQRFVLPIPILIDPHVTMPSSPPYTIRRVWNAKSFAPPSRHDTRNL